MLLSFSWFVFHVHEYLFNRITKNATLSITQQYYLLMIFTFTLRLHTYLTGWYKQLRSGLNQHHTKPGGRFWRIIISLSLIAKTTQRADFEGLLSHYHRWLKLHRGQILKDYYLSLMTKTTERADSEGLLSHCLYWLKLHKRQIFKIISLSQMAKTTERADSEGLFSYYH